ncbi:hypothetical protein D5086_026866 [Populus alba]|uniref:Uncharacterized protein n=1 Tax=Populus alba TaxID=43335 RepID=A0ACC4B4J7_POPAL
MQQLRSRGSSLFGSQLKRKALNSWTAIQDTYFSTMDIFERHKVVFTIGTSVASVCYSLAGYSLRHLRDSKVDQRLEGIENAMKKNYHLEHAEFKKLVDPGHSSVAACIATAGTAFVIGYGFGWRGGRWHANKKFRKEQMKLSGQIKPRRWQLLGRIKPRGWQFQFLKKRSPRSIAPENAVKTSEKMALYPYPLNTVDSDIDLEDNNVQTMTWLIFPSGVNVRPGIIRITLLSIYGGQGSVSELVFAKTLVETYGYACEEHAALLSSVTIQSRRSDVYPSRRTKLFSDKSQDGMAAALAPSVGDGVCASMIEPQDYICEEHPVTTEDGCILSLQRIPAWDCQHSGNQLQLRPGITSFTGQNCCLNSSIVDVFLSHEPQSTATKNMIHISQMIRTGTIAMYDYGNENDNMDHYGQPTPPVYNMTSIPNDLPLFLGYGGKDYITDVRDVQVLLDNLKDHDGDKLVVQYTDEYAHADFVLGVNANQIVYDPAIAFFKIN